MGMKNPTGTYKGKPKLFLVSMGVGGVHSTV